MWFTYWNHMNAAHTAVLQRNRPMTNICQVLISGEGYLTDAMRYAGADEKYITGDATNKEKFIAYCTTLGTAFGNPLYHWSQVELEEYFGCTLEINEARNRSMIGKTISVLCEDYDPVAEVHYGRSAADAPEIDGKVYFKSPRRILPGSFVDVVIDEVVDYDVFGRAILNK